VQLVHWGVYVCILFDSTFCVDDKLMTTAGFDVYSCPLFLYSAL